MCLRLYACLLVMPVLYEFDILTRYFEYMFIVCVCVCACDLGGGAAYLVCNGMSHFGVLGVFLGNDMFDLIEKILNRTFC
jgi:hypothetical protein